MIDTEKTEFAALLKSVMDYYGKDVTPFLVSIYWDGLKRFEFEDVSRALSAHAQNPDNGQFWPKLADIVRMLEGSTESQGMRAWSKVRSAITSVGKMQSVVFDDPLIHVCIAEMGGWYALASCMEAELPFKARDFEKRYQAYRARREIPEFQPMLVGSHESENRLNGFPNRTKPVLIGNPERAQLVLERGKGQGAVRITDGKVAAEKVAARLQVSTRSDNEPEPPRAA
ncbi:MAG: hypothetical protein GAK28_00153 [Luteibacter sp.]|uniref:DUF6475 domain-containing protein n=1 Tax=Luteibacter sp. TaxID=1886636 RepID=UPI00137CE663|nr:DUF6475 domain-containing protein [Luteibacter sp.]KAF1009515.1 MAG: hypothetical protein GAK28_00153 [Luteibacter sp.]